MERKIGERFEFEGKTLEVVASCGSCYGCFLVGIIGRCIKFTNENGDCRGGFRKKEEQSIIYKEIAK